MKKKFFLFFLIPVLSFGQVNSLEINQNGSYADVKINNKPAYTISLSNTLVRVTAVVYSANAIYDSSKVNVRVGEETYTNLIASNVKVNGISALGFTDLRNKVTQLVVSGSGGGGSGTSDATAANQVALNVLTSRQVDSITNLLAISRRKIALDSGYLRSIQDSTNKQIVQLDSLIAATKRNTGGAASSDSLFIKQITAQLKTQRTADSIDFKRQLDSTIRANDDRRLLTKEATQLSSKDTLTVIAAAIRLVGTIQKQNQTIDSIGKLIVRQDTIIKKQNDLINLQNVFNNLSLINNDTTNIISGIVRALLKGYTDSVANSNSKLQSQISNQLRTIDTLFAINNTLKKNTYDIGGNLKVTPNSTDYTTIISGSNTSIPTVFKAGFIEWLNPGTGTVTITTSGGGSTVLTSSYSVRSWLPIDSKNYTGISITLSGGALIQWSFNN